MAKKRKDFKDKYKWKVEDLFASLDNAKEEEKYLTKEINKFKKYHNHILDNANILLELLDLDILISQKIERLYVYAHLNHDADTNDVVNQEFLGKVRNLYTKYLENTSFIIPELLKSDYQIITKYLKINPDLKKYRRLLKNIFRGKNHILNSDVEFILSSYSTILDSPNEIMSSLSDSDMSFGKIKVDGKLVELTNSNYSTYLRSNNREVRKDAFNLMHKTYSLYKNTFASTLKNEVLRNVISSRLRKYKNSLNASLFENELDEKVYYNLIESVHNNLPTLYKYWDLKKKILKLDKLHIYDTYTEIEFKNNQKYSYLDAKNLILESVKPLGENYLKDITLSFDNGWIDSCNNEGKRSGAYCTCAYLTHPYVLLSYENTINDVSTLIHELGHAMHYYYASQNQLYQDYNYSIFVAEVASQINEILLSRYLLDHTDNKLEKIRIIDELLQKYKSTIFRQTMFAEFELFIHEYTEKGGILTYENMSNKYYDLNKLYYGKDIIIDDLIRYEWARIPHFYMNFYVYQYATGFAYAIKIANEIYNGNKEMRDNYLRFLKLGCSKNPQDSLKIVGIDITKNDVFNESISYMNTLINEYNLLIGEDLK